MPKLQFDILSQFDPITLEEMKAVKLMNRIDEKYLLTLEQLQLLFEFALKDYYIQEIDGCRLAQYHTRYYDTPNHEMYHIHLSGKKVREKIRVRTYIDSNLIFLEVKNKNNKGRTKKKRIEISDPDNLDQSFIHEFLSKHAWYALDDIALSLENRFSRVTLVNRARTERLTIDLGVWFHNIRTGNEYLLKHVAIVELKRDGRVFSPIRRILRDMRIKPQGFSKYCMGCVFTNPSLKHNRFKERKLKVMKLNSDI